jgi:outer membrane protein OmpA-like peptidoglycan-associated protein
MTSTRLQMAFVALAIVVGPVTGRAAGAGAEDPAHAEADGTFTIHLEDDNAPAGAPSGDLARRGAKAPPSAAKPAAQKKASHEKNAGKTGSHASDPPAKAARKTAGHGTDHADAHDAHAKPADAHDAHAKPADAHDAHAEPADAHDAHAEPADAHDAHAKPADAHDAHAKPADPHDADADADSDADEETHELLAPEAKPKKKRRPRDWKPLSGTGFPEGRRNKWGVVEAVPPAIAARARMGFRGDEIQFPDKVHFTRDSIRFAAGADEVLGQIASQLQSSPEITTLWIEGHTDFDGSEAYNQKLSEARASAVREALVRLGVAPERLVAYGFGESRPIVGGRKGSNVHENRRVVFRLVSGDRPALQTRQAVEFGQAAVVGVWGSARWRLSALGGAKHGARRLSSNALARLDAGGGGGTASDAEPNYAAEAEAAAEQAPSVGAARATADAEADGWQTLEFRTQLPEGAVLETAAGARVLLRLPDLTRVLVEQDTRLALTKLFHSRAENKSYTSARLETGAISVVANPDERGISSSIWSFAGGALELTSADFELRAAGNGAAIALLRGAASASTGGAQSIPLKPGERLEPGGTAARPMLDRPEVESPLTGTTPSAKLVWKPLANAARYRYEVAEDISFLQPARAEFVDGSNVDVLGLESGRTWYWRVRAADGDGTLGRPSRVYAFRVGPAPATAPVAPAPVSPAPH